MSCAHLFYAGICRVMRKAGAARHLDIGGYRGARIRGKLSLSRAEASEIGRIPDGTSLEGSSRSRLMTAQG